MLIYAIGASCAMSTNIKCQAAQYTPIAFDPILDAILPAAIWRSIEWFTIFLGSEQVPTVGRTLQGCLIQAIWTVRSLQLRI
jgi:hypothetical protein